MATELVNPPYPLFSDSKGEELNNGYLHIGTPLVDPESNPVTVYWDSAQTQPAVQPLRTVNGYISRSGSPSRVFLNGDYSIKVKDKQDRTVYTSLSENNLSSINPSTVSKKTVSDMDSALDIILGDQVFTKEYSAGSGGGNRYEIVAAGTGTDDGGSYIDLTGSGLQARALWYNGIQTPEQYGAKGDGIQDDTTSLQAVLSNGGAILGKNGNVYSISTRMVISVANTVFDMNGSIVKPVAAFPNTVNFIEVSAVDCVVRSGEVDGNKANLTNPFTSGATGCGLIFKDGSDRSRAIGVYVHDTPSNGLLALGSSSAIDGIVFERCRSIDNDIGGIGAEAQTNGSPLTNLSILNTETSGNILGGDLRIQGCVNFLVSGHNGHNGSHGGAVIGVGEAKNVCTGKIVNSHIGNANTGLSTLSIDGLVGGAGMFAGELETIEVDLDNVTLTGNSGGTGLLAENSAIVTGGTVTATGHNISFKTDSDSLVAIERPISKDCSTIALDINSMVDFPHAKLERWGAASPACILRASSSGSLVKGGFGAVVAETGAHDGSGNASTLTDTSASFIEDQYIGFYVRNTTDGSKGLVTSNTATTVTATLSGGSENDWDVSDAYEITRENGSDGVSHVGSPSNVKLNIESFTGTGSSKGLVSGAVASTWEIRNLGFYNMLEIEDGISAPVAESGRAKLYVDLADGDLKIVFGDGTIKIIAADT